MNSRDFQVGDRVEHPEFGEGLVLDSRGKGDAATVVVAFPDKSQRKLMVRFANLKLIGSQTPEAS
jgi:ATP-dependent DNA helicase UvrD/PcrA